MEMSVRRVVQMRFSGAMGGAENVALSLARILSSRLDSSIAYIVLEKRAGDRACAEMLERVKASGAGYKVFYTDKRFSLGLLKELRKSLIEDRAEIIHGHCYKSAFYGLALKAIGAGCVKKSVVTLHGLFEPMSIGFALIRLMDALSTMLSDRVIGCSREVASRYSRLPFVKAKTDVVQNGLVISAPRSMDALTRLVAGARSRMARAYGLDESALWVACVGRLAPQKNFSLFIKTAKEMLSSGRLKSKCEFLIVGSGAQREELERLAKEEGVGKSIFFTSYIADTDMLYSSIDLLMQTSLWEGTPMCLLEAMSFGKTAVATAVGGVPDVIDDGVNGFLAPSGDYARLAELATNILNDDGARARAGMSALSGVHKRHSHEAWAKSHMRIYDHLLGGA